MKSIRRIRHEWQLECELGVKIFFRDGREMLPTGEGALVIEHLRQVLKTRQKMYEYFSHASRQSPPVILVFTAIINPLFEVMEEIAGRPGLRLEQIMAHRSYLDSHQWDLVLFSSEKKERTKTDPLDRLSHRTIPLHRRK